MTRRARAEKRVSSMFNGIIDSNVIKILGVVEGAHGSTIQTEPDRF